METEYSKATEYGNYLGMDNQAFPIDCETLAALQNNTKKLAALGWIAGCNKLILIGCNIAGRERKEGYVFVVSSDNPLTGEVLYYKGGSSSEDKCHISEKTVNVTADGTDFPKAYSIRMLEDGVAGEPMNWADFGNVNEISNLKLFQSIKKEVSDITSVITRAINSEATNRDKAISSAISTEVTNRNSAISSAISAEETNRDKAISSAISSEVTNRNSAISSAISTEVTNRDKAITSEIQKISVFVKGMIIMWSGTVNTIPEGWALCDGKDGRPNLIDRFVVGGGNKYPIGGTPGGAVSQSVTLTESNLPSHKHSGITEYNQYINAQYNTTIKQPLNRTGFPDGSKDNGNGTNNSYGREAYWRGSSDIKVMSSPHLATHKHTFTTNSVGDGKAFTVNTIPPYYALAFIIKL